MKEDIKNLLKEYGEKIDTSILKFHNYKKGVGEEKLEFILDDVRKLKDDYFNQLKSHSLLLRLMGNTVLFAGLIDLFYHLQTPHQRERFWYEKHEIAGNYLALSNLERHIIRDLK